MKRSRAAQLARVGRTTAPSRGLVRLTVAVAGASAVALTGGPVAASAARTVSAAARLSPLSARSLVTGAPAARCLGGRTALARRSYRTCVSPVDRVAARLAAAANSDAARSAESELQGALTSPSVASPVPTLVSEYGGQPSPPGVQALDTLFATPANRALIGSLEAGQPPTGAKARRLARLLAGLVANPAITRLEREGRGLKAHPAQLTADLKAVLATRISSLSASTTDNSALNALTSTLATVLGSPAVNSFSDRLRAVLAGPGAIQYLETLPPLALGSLAELAKSGPGQLLAATRMRSQSTGSGPSCSSPPTYPYLGALVAKLADDAGVIELPSYGAAALWLAEKAASWSPRLGVKIAALEVNATILIGAFATVFSKTTAVGIWAYASWVAYGAETDFLEAGAEIAQFLQPPKLALCPNGPTTIVPGGQVSYTVYEYDFNDRNLGSTTKATLSIIPAGDGQCPGYTCTATAPGIHTVIATLGATKAYSELTVTGPTQLTLGPLDHLALSPTSSSISPRGSQTYTVEAFDAANDDLGPLTDATLAISPDGSCTGYACTASTAGAHTVTAIDATARGTATLTVITSSVAPCVFSASGPPDCQSTDPFVTDEATTQAASGCTLSDNIDWGDGSPVQTVDFAGSGPLETFPIAEYTYSTPGTYSITASAPVAISGPCAGGVGRGNNYQFTLLSSGGSP